MRDVLNNFDTIVKKVSMVISNKQNHKSYYFNFIARSLVVMFLVFMCRPDDIPRMVYTCMKLPIITNDGLPISTAIQNKFFSQVYVFTSDNFIEPQVLIGVSIVNSMRKYITSYCTDDSCIGLKKYGEYFLNADTY